MKTILDGVESLGQEVTRAVASYYVRKTIHREMARDPAIHAALNATSWASAHILFSLQCSFFIQFERVFDRSSQHSVDKVVDAAIEHAKVHNPKRTRSLRRLRQRVRQYADRAKPYRDIRRKVFAHPALRDLNKVNNLFAKTEVSDIEAILLFLQRCVSSLRMYILNGHDVNLRHQKLPFKDNVIADTRKLVRQLKYRSR